MDAPPLPFDQFPIVVRLAGRPLLGELWKGCFQGGVEAGMQLGFAKGLVFGIVGTTAFALILLVVGLVAHHAFRDRSR